MVKVISFSLWGNDPTYTIGAIKNADAALTMFPGFECWFYVHTQTVPIIIIQELLKLPNVTIIEKTGDLRTCKPMMWRFEPLFNPEVELFMSRDTDTRFLKREIVSVMEWLNSDKLLHIMRDHPHHVNKIMGGMWGMKRNNLCDLKKLIQDCKQTGHRDYDQDFLEQIIYPIYKDTAYINASYNAYEQDARPFTIPYLQDRRFVGEYVYADESRSPRHYSLITLPDKSN